MKILLLEKINRLGDLGDEIQVKPGYARNYLVPQGKACYATPENRKVFEGRKEKLQQAEQEKIEHANQRHTKLHGLVVTLPARVSSNSKLFGSVTQADIIKSIKSMCDVGVEKKEIINMPGGAIRELGEYNITVQLHSDVRADITVKIVASAA